MNDNSHTLVVVWYYAITTLSTIGFGDFSPKSVQEKLLGAFILMLGVAVFSIIMNNLMDILRDLKSIDQVGDHKDLSKWIAMLSKFNGGNPLSKEIITNIEDFFDFYWSNNKMIAFQSDIDKRFMHELPDIVTHQIYIDYVYKDFVYMFKNLFKYIDMDKKSYHIRNSDLDNFNFRRHLVELLKGLEPR